MTPRPPSKSTSAGNDLVIPLPTTKTRRAGTPKAPSSSSVPSRGWSHRPTPTTLLWLAVSLPLVAWDTGYVLLRPHSMPGGALHWPLWAPYELYGRVDHVYGFKAWDNRVGFTGAQGMMNLVETGMFALYWGLWYRNRGADGRVGGREGGLAVAIGFAACVMTFSKTVLYCELFSSRDKRDFNGWG
jgi:hypothetical protein